MLRDAHAEIVGDADVEISRTAAEDVDVEAVFAGGHAGIVALWQKGGSSLRLEGRKKGK